MWIAILLIFAGACKKGSKTEVIPDPVKALLVFPAQNEACTSGTIISATQSSLKFTWNKAEHTDNYELVLKNLLTNTSSTFPSGSAELELTLSRNTPYSWSIISKSTKSASTAQSETWKFYNSGPAVTVHIPFPADIVSPILGANINAVNGKVTLDWDGSDVDNDIASYDVYLDTSSDVKTLLSGNITAHILNDVAVKANTLYYWKIVTRDAKGNTSTSTVSQFKVN